MKCTSAVLPRVRTSKVDAPGTYLGVIEKIPYLQSLGVTAVELMPVHEFPIRDIYGKKMERPNYWGYDPNGILFAAPRLRLLIQHPGAQVNEFKEMVKALHAAGIEVILDVVFNHTCEGNERGPTLSFKGLENQVYYIPQRRPALFQLQRLWKYAERKSSSRSRNDFSLPATLGAQLSHRRFSL